MEGLPHAVYYAVGFTLLTNLGILGGVFRAVWWIAKADSRLEQVEKDLDFLFKKQRAEKPDTQGVS